MLSSLHTGAIVAWKGFSAGRESTACPECMGVDVQRAGEEDMAETEQIKTRGAGRCHSSRVPEVFVTMSVRRGMGSLPVSAVLYDATGTARTPTYIRLPSASVISACPP